MSDGPAPAPPLPSSPGPILAAPRSPARSRGPAPPRRLLGEQRVSRAPCRGGGSRGRGARRVEGRERDDGALAPSVAAADVRERRRGRPGGPGAALPAGARPPEGPRGRGCSLSQSRRFPSRVPDSAGQPFPGSARGRDAGGGRTPSCRPGPVSELLTRRARDLSVRRKTVVPRRPQRPRDGRHLPRNRDEGGEAAEADQLQEALPEGGRGLKSTRLSLSAPPPWRQSDPQRPSPYPLAWQYSSLLRIRCHRIGLCMWAASPC
nr:collagen alpha-1(I) chain-like [Dasypus novemcinctus]